MTNTANLKNIKELEEKLSLMIEATSDYTSAADLQGNLWYLNKAGREMIGLDENADISKLKIADVHPAWATKIIQEKGIPEALKTGIWRGETALLHRNGQEMPVSQVIISHKNPDGEVDLLATIMRDISEQKKEEKILQESQRQLNEAQHLAKIGSWNWVVATDTVTWSDELYRINGRDLKLPPVPYIKQSSCYTSESWLRLDKAVKNTLATGEPYELELEFIRADGVHLLCFVRGEAIKDDKGKVIQLTGIVQDITEKEKEQKELKSKIMDLEKLKELTIGRELKMVELKKLLQQTQGELEKLKNDH